MFLRIDPADSETVGRPWPSCHSKPTATNESQKDALEIANGSHRKTQSAAVESPTVILTDRRVRIAIDATTNISNARCVGTAKPAAAA